MRILKFFCFFSITFLLNTIVHAQSNQLVQNLYFYAKQANSQALQGILSSGQPIDSTDADGNTALCISLLKKDMKAYDVLRAHGANEGHPCVQKAMAASSGSSFVWKPAYTVGALTVAAGVGVAAAAGGGGGGGGGDGGSESKDSSKPVQTPSDPKYFETSEYYKGNFLSQIKASTAYSRFFKLNNKGQLTSSLKNVKVGVVDTGLYAVHTDFKKTKIEGFNRDFGPCQNGDTTNCWTYSTGRLVFTDDSVPDYKLNKTEFEDWAKNYNNYDWDQNKDTFYPIDAEPTNIHGTHVSGIIAADKNAQGMHGVAFSNADILMTRWDYMYAPSLVISELVDKGAQVINMSFSVEAKDNPASNIDDLYYEEHKKDLDEMIANGLLKAANKNVVMVMAAGNESQNQPGLYNGVARLSEFKDKLQNLFITVVATDDNGKITPYSNRCGVAQDYCIAAPGGTKESKIISTGTYDVETYALHGTSMATPVVSGSIALLMGAYPYLTPQEIVSLIFETANKKGDYANKEVYGNGMLDLAEATNPQGYLATIKGESVQNQKTNVASSNLVVPTVFKEAMLASMPQSITVFDKYKRPFDIQFSSLVQTTHGSFKNFKNDFAHFMRLEKPQNIKAENLSMRFAPMSDKPSSHGLGFIEGVYQKANTETSFFYAQNTYGLASSAAEKATFNPYLALNEAYGLGKAYSFKDFGVKMSFMYGKNGLYDGDRSYHDRDFDKKAYAFDAAFSYKMLKNLDLSFVTGLMREDEALLGLNGSGALGLGDAQTYYTGVVLRYKPVQKLFFSAAFYQGYTSANRQNDSMIRFSALKSRSFAFDTHYEYTNGGILGFELSSPLRIYNGHADFDISVGRDAHSDKIYRQNIRAQLKPKAREYKFALYHNKQASENLVFKTELAMRLHPEHQKEASNDYRAMFGLFFKF